MAAITTAQAGNWSATGTWIGGVIPGIGDTVTLNHAVTVDDARTVGTSPSNETTNVITLANGIVLTVADNITFQVRGNVAGNNNASAIVIGEGSTLRFDASNATTTSTTYKVIIGKIGANGETVNRSVIESDAGGGNAYFTNPGSGNGWSNFQLFFCDVRRIGDSSNPAIDSRVTTGGWGDKTNDSTFDADCGMLTGSTIQTDRIIRFLRTAFLQTAPTNPFSFVCAAGTPTGDHHLQDCFFRKRVILTGFQEWQKFDGNVFADGWTAASHGDYVAGAAKNNLFHGPNQISISGDILDWYIIQTTATNPQFCDLTNSRDVTVDGIIFEHTGSDSSGECIIVTSPGSVRVHIIKRPIVLPNAGGAQSGALLTSLGNANNTYSLERATCLVSASTGGVQVGETYNTHAGFFSKFKDSIFYNPSGPAGFKIRNINGAPITDVVTAANADFNCGFGLSAGSEGKGYDTPMTGTPGANDVDEDPNFVAETRDAAAWNSSLGGLGTIADMLDEFAKISSAGFDSNYTVVNLNAYVQAGFAPQNQNLKGAASDAGDIGAVPVVGGPPGFSSLRIVFG